jgi:hypothetical protein
MFLDLQQTTATSPASNGGLNIGLVAGVIVGAVVLLAIVAIIIGVLIWRRRTRIRREKNVSSFVGEGEESADGKGSTARLVYRLGDSRRYAGNPLFDTNVKTIQATAAAMGGSEGGGADNANNLYPVLPADGAPAVGEEDVSIMAKGGMKVVMNTNVASAGWQTGHLPPRVVPDTPPEYPTDEEISTKC